MARARSDSRDLEGTNRRETVELVVVFLVLFCALGFGLDFVIGTVRIIDGRLIGFPVLTLAALVIGSIQALASFYGGAGLVLASVHARPLIPDSPNQQMVIDVVQEMAVAAQMPVPRAYIIDDEAPNAFATGRDPQHSVICVTQGLVDTMDREELQGVLGHEMAHIRDYDIRTMMMIAVLVGGVAMLADFVRRWMWYGGFGGGGRRGGSRDGGGNAGALIAIAVLGRAVLAPIFSQLLASAVSRQRVHRADPASGAATRTRPARLRAV